MCVIPAQTDRCRSCVMKFAQRPGDPIERLLRLPRDDVHIAGIDDLQALEHRHVVIGAVWAEQ